MFDDLQALSDEKLARRMAGFKPGTADHILCQHELNRRLQLNGPLQQKVSAMSELKIFISHSSRDRSLAGALADLLRAALSVRPDQIRCTSVDGYKLPAGAKHDPALKQEVQRAEAFIGIITPASIESAYVLFELGARWSTDKSLVPLLGGGADASFLRGPLSGYNALHCDSSAHLRQLIEDLGSQLNIKPCSAASYEAQIKKVISASRKLKTANKNSPVSRPIKSSLNKLLGPIRNKQAATPKDVFVEHYGALFKRKPEGGYHRAVYCPLCKTPAGSPDGIPYHCRCGWIGDFGSHELLRIMATLPP